MLSGKRLGAGNVMAASLGIVTPFCSCSAVPLFIGFLQAKASYPVPWLKEPIGGNKSLGMYVFGALVWVIFGLVGCWFPLWVVLGFLQFVPLFVGTLKVTVISMVLSVPIAVAAAVYVAEHAPQGQRGYFTAFIQTTATIGLLLCRTKNKLEAEYALRGFNKPIGVAEWETQIVDRLPEELRGSLPTVEEIEAELARDEGQE